MAARRQPSYTLQAVYLAVVIGIMRITVSA